MNSFKELIPINNKLNFPLYSQIMNALITNIRKGYLRRGLKLPGPRELAALFSSQKITKSFRKIEWLEIIPHKGTFVVKDIPYINP